MNKNHDALWDSNSDMLYYAKNNAECLNDFNTAINALYALSAGAYSADTRNTTTYTQSQVDAIGVNVSEWANRLEMARSLIFGESLDWEYCRTKLEEYAKNHESE